MLRLPHRQLSVLSWVGLVAGAVTVPIHLRVDSSMPNVSPALISLSVEGDRWTDWTGASKRNFFFFNALDNLKQIVGSPPDIRIGANSEDHTNFRQDVKFTEASFPPYSATVPYPEANNIMVGDSYYATTRFLPRNTHVTWGVNFGSNNVTAAYLEMKSILKAFSSSEVRDAGIVLDFLELGNEPDLYRNNGLRQPTYNVSQYVQEWISVAENLTISAGLTATSETKLLAASFAGSSHTINGFSPQAVFEAGILDSVPGKVISTISQHRYSGSFCSGNGGLLQDLMTKSTIRSNLSVFIPDIAATRSRGLDYILGETNSYACHRLFNDIPPGSPGVSNTAGAALWALDYALYATQLGISKVFFHVGIGFKYNLIQPVTLNRSILDGSPLPEPLMPHIHPQYYAAIIAAEALRHGAQVLELHVDHSYISGYGFYERNSLRRAVFINSKAYLPENANRTAELLQFQFLGAARQSPVAMSIKRLEISHATEESGVTWGGQSYETPDARIDGALRPEHGRVADGVSIQDTEVILLEFH